MSKYRFCIMQPYHIVKGNEWQGIQQQQEKDLSLPKEKRLMNYEVIKHLLEDIDWDLHPGPAVGAEQWGVETHEEFAYVTAQRLPLIREVIESGKYNALIAVGGGQPGFLEGAEIGRKYGVVVTGNAHAQMHIATMLGHKFSIIDLSEAHNMHMHRLVLQHHMDRRCASIRNINFPLPRKGMDPNVPQLGDEQRKAVAGEESLAVERSVEQAIKAIQEDGADVIMFGCSRLFWLQPFIQQRLDDLGYGVPVLEGYSSGITMAKLMVDLGVTMSGTALPSEFPKFYREKKVF